MSLEQEVHKGNNAKRILEEPIVQDFFKIIRENIFNEWRNSGARDLDGREKCHQLMKVVDEFERHFRKYMEGGVLATAQIAATEKIKEQKHYGV